MATSYKEFTDRIRRRIWPSPGEHSSLVDAHDGFFLEAFGDLMKWIPCVQANHTDVHPVCSTYVQCGKTLLDAPVGVIRRVYTIANGIWCNPVEYLPSNMREIECWSRNLLTSFVNPANAGLPALQQGIKFVEPATDSKWGRSRTGIWAIYRNRLYLAPWVQSNESVIVEWDGIKWKWNANDLVDEELWTPDYENAIKLFVKHHHDRDYEPAVQRMELKDMLQEYYDARAMLIHSCEQRIDEQQVKECCETRFPTQAEITSEAVPASGNGMVFCILGDFGRDNSIESDVATLVKSWNPEFIVTTGDNYYGPGNTGVVLSDIDAAIGKYYREFLYPYIGSYGAGASEQKMYPTVGNHDRDPSDRLGLEEQYFNFINPYYEFLKGPIHFLVYDSGFDNSQVNQQADGNDVNSKQAAWLQAKLAMSTARFKIVFVHHPPFSSSLSAINIPPLAGDGTISFPDLRLPFKDWGADAVISGHVHNYERLIASDGLTYICNGAGGQTGQDGKEPALFNGTPQSISLVRYNSDYGAMKCRADCNTLTMEFWTRGGLLIDTCTLNK